MMGNETASLKKESLQKALCFWKKKEDHQLPIFMRKKGTRALLALLLLLLRGGGQKEDRYSANELT